MAATRSAEHRSPSPMPRCLSSSLHSTSSHCRSCSYSTSSMLLLFPLSSCALPSSVSTKLVSKSRIRSGTTRTISRSMLSAMPSPRTSTPSLPTPAEPSPSPSKTSSTRRQATCKHAGGVRVMTLPWVEHSPGVRAVALL
eukprot:Rmarinus@m.10049